MKNNSYQYLTFAVFVVFLIDYKNWWKLID